MGLWVNNILYMFITSTAECIYHTAIAGCGIHCRAHFSLQQLYWCLLFDHINTTSITLNLEVTVKAVFFPGVALRLLGEYGELGSNYLATRLYGATLGGKY
jgi:hypothetical protein